MSSMKISREIPIDGEQLRANKQFAVQITLNRVFMIGIMVPTHLRIAGLQFPCHAFNLRDPTRDGWRRDVKIDCHVHQARVMGHLCPIGQVDGAKSRITGLPYSWQRCGRRHIDLCKVGEQHGRRIRI